MPPQNNWTEEQWSGVPEHGGMPSGNFQGGGQPHGGYQLPGYPSTQPQFAGGQINPGPYNNIPTRSWNPSNPTQYPPQVVPGQGVGFQATFPPDNGYGNTGPQAGIFQNTERRCANCGEADTPEWRTDPRTGHQLCNACGLYVRTQGTDRPMSLIVGPQPTAQAPEGYDGRQCSHCRAIETSAWRRHPTTKELLCNACGRYLYDTGQMRDLTKPRGVRGSRRLDQQ